MGSDRRCLSHTTRSKGKRRGGSQGDAPADPDLEHPFGGADSGAVPRKRCQLAGCGVALQCAPWKHLLLVPKCVHAGMVAAAYLQAKDQGSYARWKEVERQDCNAAGVPR